MAQTSAPAEDDLRPMDYAARRIASPYTVLHLLAGRDAGEEAAATARRWRRTGVLRSEAQERHYRYELHWLTPEGPQAVRALVGALAVAPPEGDAVAPHERIQPDRLVDRRHRVRTAAVEAAPLLVVADGMDSAWSEVLSRPPPEPPVAALTDESGVDHRLWRLGVAEGQQAAAALRGARGMIADGHHRWAALRELAGERLRLGHPPRRTLAVVADAAWHGPAVRPVHWLVRNLGGRVDRLATLGHSGEPREDVAALEREVAASRGACFGVVTRSERSCRRWLAASDAPSDSDDPAVAWQVARRRAQLLHTLRVTDHDLDAVIDPELGAAQVASGAADALVLLPLPSVRALLAAAHQGLRLPPKSTRFAPKPRVGLVLHPVDEPAAAGS